MSNVYIPRDVAALGLKVTGAVVAAFRWLRGDRRGARCVWRRSVLSARMIAAGETPRVVVNTIRRVG